jgi:hypothetical protein
LSHTMEFESARDAVRRAKRALKNAEQRFDIDCGPENSSALIAEIKLAEKRLADAVSLLDKVPASRIP